MRYADQYDPTLLFPMARAPKRQEIGIAGAPPFFGADLWTAFELSWLNRRGKPQVAIAHFTIPCETPNIVESKSLKLYLGSYNATMFGGPEEVRDRLRADLSEAVARCARAIFRRRAPVAAGPVRPGAGAGARWAEPGPPGHRLQSLHAGAGPAEGGGGGQPVEEVLTSNLLKSNCLVTGQPDWGSVQIHYTGPQIEQGGLLQYLVSFRNHNEFHEQCVERIFMDLWRQCRPTRLAVYAATRAGADWTSTPCAPAILALPANVRTARQ